MKKWMMVGLMLLCSQPVFAILSPLNQSLEEITTLVHSAEIGKKIPQGQPILQIQRTQDGYLLYTKELQMQVDLQYLPSTYPGKQQFSLVFHTPTPLVP
ncbi:hypothetical protein ACFLR2_01695 [Chlamydiota bacterium]